MDHAKGAVYYWPTKADQTPIEKRDLNSESFPKWGSLFTAYKMDGRHIVGVGHPVIVRDGKIPWVVLKYMCLYHGSTLMRARIRLANKCSKSDNLTRDAIIALWKENGCNQTAPGCLKILLAEIDKALVPAHILILAALYPPSLSAKLIEAPGKWEEALSSKTLVANPMWRGMNPSSAILSIPHTRATLSPGGPKGWDKTLREAILSCTLFPVNRRTTIPVKFTHSPALTGLEYRYIKTEPMEKQHVVYPEMYETFSKTVRRLSSKSLLRIIRIPPLFGTLPDEMNNGILVIPCGSLCETKHRYMSDIAGIRSLVIADMDLHIELARKSNIFIYAAHEIDMSNMANILALLKRASLLSCKVAFIGATDILPKIGPGSIFLDMVRFYQHSPSILTVQYADGHSDWGRMWLWRAQNENNPNSALPVATNEAEYSHAEVTDMFTCDTSTSFARLRVSRHAPLNVVAAACWMSELPIVFTDEPFAWSQITIPTMRPIVVSPNVFVI